jgi:RNA polymerase sigma-70 factor (ECF subfamily)
LFNNSKKTDFSELSDDTLYRLLSDKKEIAEKAFAALYNRHSQRVWAYCLRFLGDRETAQDVLQETFTRFFRSVEQEKKIGNIPGFLLRIARNLCLNQTNNIQETVPFEDEAYYSPDDSGDRKELIELIKKALKYLPEDYREAFVLREYEGLTYQEIADLTGESMSNVKVRIHRARAKIKDLLAGYEKEFSDHNLKML